MAKLTRKAQILIFTLVLCLFFGFGYYLIRDTQKPEEQSKETHYDITIVAEDEKIISTYIDSISSTNASKEYKVYNVTVPKGTKIKDYILTQEQSFSKYLKLEGPNDKDLLTKKSKQKITHYAYSMLLEGDVIEKTNTSTKEKTYEIVNARITYNQIPIVLLSNENSVCIRNEKKTKEKIVNLQDFINALKDTEKRNEMIYW